MFDTGVDSLDICETVAMSNAPDNVTAAAGSAPPSGMRWPIHLQLLIPMVSVVLLASLLATAITAFWIALRVRTEQRESLRRMVKTLGEAAAQFPLTENVLGQMSGLSGAQFVLMTPQGRRQESTLTVETAELRGPRRLAHARANDDAREMVIALGDRNYLVDFVSISRRVALHGARDAVYSLS